MRSRRGGRTSAPAPQPAPAPSPEPEYPDVRATIEGMIARLEQAPSSAIRDTHDAIIDELIGVYSYLPTVPQPTPDEALVLGRRDTVFRPYEMEAASDDDETARTALLGVLAQLIAPEGGRRSTRRRRPRKSRRRRTQK